MNEGAGDPVLVRRARVAGAVRVGKTVGYGCFLIACLAFVVLVIGKPTPILTGVITGCLTIGSLALAPAIVFGYAVKAAEREERETAASIERRRAGTAGTAGTDTQPLPDH